MRHIEAGIFLEIFNVLNAIINAIENQDGFKGAYLDIANEALIKANHLVNNPAIDLLTEVL